MNKKAAKRYSPRIGQLMVNFLDYYRAHERLLREGEDPWDLNEGLESFGSEEGLTLQETYQVALMLKEQGYPIDPSIFHPEYVAGSEESLMPGVLQQMYQSRSAYDDYDKALREKKYGDAHRIYESMTPAQQQVIRDRRGTMTVKLKKMGQTMEEATLEKEVPIEGNDELVEQAEELVNQHHSMNLPPQSMAVFMPLGHALDEYKRSGDPEQYQQLVAAFNRVREYMNQWVKDLPREASVARKILALASKLQEKGASDLSKRLLKAIQKQGEDWGRSRINPSKWSPESEVTDDLVDSPLAQFQSLLRQEKYNEAREAYLNLDPVDRREADEIAKLHFAASTLLSLYVAGEKLFNKGKYSEAAFINRVIKSQFLELTPELQKQVILIIVPEDELANLPQAFEGTKDAEENTRIMEERVTDMKSRLNPSLCGSAILRLLKLADKLDEQGRTEEVTQIDNWLKKQAQAEGTEELLELAEQYGYAPEKKKRQDIKVGKCPGCEKEVYYEGVAPAYCRQCQKDPWPTHPRRGSLGIEAKGKKDKKDKKKDKKKEKKEDGKPAKVVEIADALRRDNPDMDDKTAYKISWESYCSYINPSHSGCTEKGKSKRKSPKPYRD